MTGRIQNLKPWRPGQSGNPSGRPKKKWLSEVVEEVLEERLSDPAFRAAFKDMVWTKLLSNGVAGAMTLDRIWERTEGKVVQPVDVGVQMSIKQLLEAGRKRLDEGDDFLPPEGGGGLP